MKTLTFILYFITPLFSNSQADTIRVNVEEMSIDRKTCECILFRNCREFSYPVSSYWKRSDSLFIGNQDTIYFILMNHGTVILEGNKQPKGQVFGKVKLYNRRSELIKVELWEPVYLIRENDAASWSDGYYWSTQSIYQKNQITKEKSRFIIYDEKKGYAQKTEVHFFKNGESRRIKTKIQYF